MSISKDLKKYENILISLVSVSILFACIFYVYDGRYNLNDDVMIRNIISGAYTGSPSPMNAQMLYPFSFLLSILYSILPGIPWFDLLLTGCQYICLVVILNGILKYFNSNVGKLFAIVAYSCFVVAFFMEHIIFVTYTVTSGFIAVTAIFVFICYQELSIIKKSIICVLFTLLAFCIRTEMMLMLMPFVVIAGIYCWSNESNIFTKHNVIKYFGIFFAIIICFVSTGVIDKAVYSIQGWNEFNSFFDSRTTIYDYTDIPKYDENKEFYQDNHISYEQYLILVSYDFSLDDNINSDMLKTIAEYAQSKKDIKEKSDLATESYRIQITDKIGTLYHTLVVLEYLIFFLAISKKNIFKIIITGVVIFATRSCIWLYLLGEGRTPERITHPLYWAEFILLLSIFIIENNRNNLKYEKIKKLVAIIVISICSICFIGSQITSINERYAVVENKVKITQEIEEYCNMNSDNFYFLPTYSTGILLMKNVFSGIDTPPNMDLAGGWFVKSPLQKEKLKIYGIENVSDALVNNDNVYIIQHDDYIAPRMEYPFEYIIKYYESIGCDIEITQVDHIENIYVYKLKQKAMLTNKKFT